MNTRGEYAKAIEDALFYIRKCPCCGGAPRYDKGFIICNACGFTVGRSMNGIAAEELNTPEKQSELAKIVRLSVQSWNATTTKNKLKCGMDDQNCSALKTYESTRAFFNEFLVTPMLRSIKESIPEQEPCCCHFNDNNKPFREMGQ